MSVDPHILRNLRQIDANMRYIRQILARQDRVIEQLIVKARILARRAAILTGADPLSLVEWLDAKARYLIQEVRDKAKENGQREDYIFVAVGLTADPKDPFAVVEVYTQPLCVTGVTVEEVASKIDAVLHKVIADRVVNEPSEED